MMCRGICLIEFPYAAFAAVEREFFLDRKPMAETLFVAAIIMVSYMNPDSEL